MNKKYISLSISFLTLFFLLQFFLQSRLLIDTFFHTVKLCFYNLFPSIFVFFIITDILANYNFPYYLSKIFGKTIGKLFKLPQISSYIIFMSMTSGFPGNSKLIKDQLDKELIDSYDATKLLTMTHFSNPLFILYTVGINFLHDQRIGIIILIIHFISNYIIGFLFRNIYKKKINNFPLKPATPRPFIELLKTSISNTFNILINVFGIVIFFALITTTINSYLNLNDYTNTLFNGLLEITNGLSLLSTLPISKVKAASIATFFLSFGGFSIHMQVMSILSKYHLNYFIYLIARILHASISAILVLLTLSLFK